MSGGSWMLISSLPGCKIGTCGKPFECDIHGEECFKFECDDSVARCCYEFSQKEMRAHPAIFSFRPERPVSFEWPVCTLGNGRCFVRVNTALVDERVMVNVRCDSILQASKIAEMARASIEELRHGKTIYASSSPCYQCKPIMTPEGEKP